MPEGWSSLFRLNPSIAPRLNFLFLLPNSWFVIKNPFPLVNDLELVKIERRIFLVRGQKIMLDADLAALYRVPTKSLNLAVKRNADRFPEDFMFQLTDDEVAGLRFHSETSKRGRGGRRYLPYAFTEQGVAMLSSVLRSPRAVQVNIAIIRRPSPPKSASGSIRNSDR